MAAAILRGGPDALLTQPKAVLPRLLAGESLAHGWGDLVTGSATLATLAGLDAARLPLTMLAVALGVAVYVSAAVTFASLAFWIAGARSLPRGCHGGDAARAGLHRGAARLRGESRPTVFRVKITAAGRKAIAE